MIQLNNNWIVVSKDDEKCYPLETTLTFYNKERELISRGRKIIIPAFTERVYAEDDKNIYIPIGLYSLLSDFFTLDVPVVDNRKVTNEKLLNVDKIISNINSYEGILEGITLRQEQLMACRKILHARRCITQLCTGAGKSEIMCAVVKMLTEVNDGICPTVIILEPTLKLVKDTIARFEKYGINAVSYSKNRRIIENAVNITHPKSLNNDLEKDSDLLNSVEVMFGDECLSRATKILLPTGEVETIENIYNDDSITEVMSYNFEKECYEPKKILRKIRTEFNDRFMKLCYINPVTSKEEFLLATPNHKIWTYNRGYVRVDELTLDDEIKVDISEKKFRNKLVCKYCGKHFDSPGALGGHVAWCSFGPHRETSMKNLASHQEGYVSPLANPDVHKKAMITRSSNSEYRQYLSNRMKENNPSYNENVVEKQKKANQEFLIKHPEKLEERKCNYIKATHKKNHITDLEQKIIDLHIPGLEFTGNGEIIYLANGRRKIPDFTFRNGDEVKYIEISSKYWYSDNYISQIIKDYEDAGLSVLYITNDNLEDLEGRIRKFLFNHRVKISRICKAGGRKSKYKYNLEIADNHNYFADNILVSNCHHMRSLSYQTVRHGMNNLVYCVGVSASAICQEHVKNKNIRQYSASELSVIGATGPLVMNVTADHMIDKGALAKPILLRFRNMANEFIPSHREFEWHKVAKVRLQSLARNKLICYIAKFFSIHNRKVLILVNTVEWSKNLLKIFDDIGMTEKVFASYGGGRFDRYNTEVSKEEDCFKEFDDGRYNVMIGTTHLYEGADIKNLDVIILGFGGKAERLQVQGIGRVLRKSKTGKYAYIVDFTDFCDKILNSQSRMRLKRYEDTIGIPHENMYDDISLSDLDKIFLKRERE